VQVSELVRFENASRIAIPFASPSRPGSILAAGFTLAMSAVTILRIDDNTGGGRWWRLGNDSCNLAARGRRVCWCRLASAPPGALELFGLPANGALVSGTALAIESQARGPGDAMQELHNLVAEMSR
jgi:hypothetical protein